MKFDGNNLIEVLDAHGRWLGSGGENDDDRADFSEADLRGFCLAYANLYGANFQRANMSGTCLFMTNLEKADLTGANLLRADFYGAKLRGAFGIPFIPQHCPDTGSFIAWKRVKTSTEKEDVSPRAIAKLLIPEDAQRLSLLNGEYRASKVQVLEIQDLEGNVLPDAVGISIKDNKTQYIPGETVSVDNFNTDVCRSHVPGIYFYLERKAAVCYLAKGYDETGNPTWFDWDTIKHNLDEEGGFGTPVEVDDLL